MQQHLEEILNEASKELGLPYDQCKEAYMSQWRFIREKISELPLKDIEEDKFCELRPNFNLPSFGKLYVTEEYFRNTRNKFNLIRELRKRKQDVQDKETETDI